jgi:very-short-patch-repair endonuclease
MARPTAIARTLRKHQTPTEGILWQHLRAKRLGHKFYRQHPIGRYVADFCCPASKLVVEVDGGHHDEPEQRAYDEERDAFMEDQGITILRVWSSDVRDNIDGVVGKILEVLGRPSP